MSLASNNDAKYEHLDSPMFASTQSNPCITMRTTVELHSGLPSSKTHFSLETPKMVISKQCGPKSDATIGVFTVYK